MDAEVSPSLKQNAVIDSWRAPLGNLVQAARQRRILMPYCRHRLWSFCLHGLWVLLLATPLMAVAELRALPGDPVLLTSHADPDREVLAEVVSFSPTPHPQDLFYRPNHVTFKIGDRVFPRVDMESLDRESRIRLMALVPPREVAFGEPLMAGFFKDGRALRDQEATFLRDLIAIECTPFQVFGINKQGTLVSLGSESEQPVDPQGNPIEGVRWVRNHGYGWAIAYTHDHEIHLFEEGRRESIELGTAELERVDHIALLGASVYFGKDQRHILLGHVLVQEGKLVTDYSTAQDPPDGLLVNFEPEDFGPDPRKRVHCIGANGRGDFFVVYIDDERSGRTNLIGYSLGLDVVEGPPSGTVPNAHEFTGPWVVNLTLNESEHQRPNAHVGMNLVDRYAIQRILPGAISTVRFLMRPNRFGDQVLFGAYGGPLRTVGQNPARFSLVYDDTFNPVRSTRSKSGSPGVGLAQLWGLDAPGPSFLTPEGKAGPTMSSRGFGWYSDTMQAQYETEVWELRSADRVIHVSAFHDGQPRSEAAKNHEQASLGAILIHKGTVEGITLPIKDPTD
jgi:hypothetical protein